MFHVTIGIEFMLLIIKYAEDLVLATGFLRKILKPFAFIN